ncbi:MAG: hypothetical protein APR55_01030 [Methanolinea sp. SDB]|nr:MAG: hypothetical protein APR55_01030 [Methanolinea sp. SDB]
MASEWQETALSEVIGFILILAIITAAASLYIVYVVPAQGREAEIRHMEYISGEFTGYKIGIDSLWINNREDVTISRTFDLGTLGGTTQGSFLNLPLFQPYGSSGTMVVNGRGDTIGYEVDALVEELGTDETDDFSSSVIEEPRHLYVKLSIDNVDSADGVLLESSEEDWKVWLNVTRTVRPQPSTTITRLPTVTPEPQGQGQGQVNAKDIENWITETLVKWLELQYDLTITVIKNGDETLSNWVIKRDISNGDYTVDLFDEAYGLSGENLSYPFELTKTEYGIDCVFPRYLIQNIETDPLLMGSLEYRSNNYYWIQQNYYYQDGAVFLEQPDDGSVVKTMPSITFDKDDPSDTLIVRIIDVVITDPIQSRSLGGTGSVEVTSFVSDITNGRIEPGTELATGIPNAKNVNITVIADSPQSALAWEGAFRQVRTLGERNGVPEDWSVAPTRSGNIVSFRITGNPINGPDDYDILLDYTRVNMSASLQSVAA